MVQIKASVLSAWMDTQPGQTWIFAVCFMGGTVFGVFMFTLINISKVFMASNPDYDFTSLDSPWEWWKSLKE